MIISRQSWILSAIDLLDSWPENGRPDLIEGLERTVAFAESIGWIERISIMRKCEGCGEYQPGYSRHIITAAGNAAKDLHRIHKARADA